MTKIMYVSLDDRACNYEFAGYLAALTDDLELLRPPHEIMGFLKRPADVEALWDWVFENAPACRYAIFSVDALVYGNLVNSRIHDLSLKACKERLQRFRKVKEIAPEMEIHAFNLVARVAAYDNSFEDPEYWSTYGYSIWRYTCLLDKEYRKEITAEEKAEQRQLQDKIPKEHLDDFLHRREVDRAVNLECVALTAERIFEILTVPKDDTSEYGMAAIDSAHLFKEVAARKVQSRVYSHLGADEVGSVLLARIFCRSKAFVPHIYVRYSSVKGPLVVPKYEDRALHESVKWQITSIGGIVSEEATGSDAMLAMNASGTKQVEAMDQDREIDSAFRANQNLPEFLAYICSYQKRYRKVVGLAEVSCCNGCENMFMNMAEESGMLRSVHAFGGWNTAQNTIGVVLAHMVIAAYYNGFKDDREKWLLSESFKLQFLTTDWKCQANFTPQYAGKIKAGMVRTDPYHLQGEYGTVRKWYLDQIQSWLEDYTRKWYPEYKCLVKKYEFDWDSLFFSNLNLELREESAE